MPAKFFGWVAGLALLGLAAACNPDVTEVAPGVSDENQLEGALLVDTFRLEGSTYLFDSTLAMGDLTGFTLVGAQRSSITGSARAIGVFDFNVPNITVAQVSPAVGLDSVKLFLPYRWIHTPTLKSGLQVELHRLSAPIDRQHVFLANDPAPAYDPEVLGVATVLDTNQAKPTGVLTYTLPTSLGQKILDIAKQGTFPSYSDYSVTSAWNRRDPEYYGFALVPRGTNTPLVNFNIYNGTSGGALRVFYSLNKQGSTTDSITGSIPMGLGLTNRYYTALDQEDRSGTETAPLSAASRVLKATAENGYRCYVQNLTALWARLQFPSYVPFRLSRPRLSLVRATLTIPADVVVPSYAGPLGQMIPWQGLADHLAVGRNGFFSRAFSNGGNSGSVTDYTINYSPVTNTYFLDVTAYLRAIDRGTAYNSGLLFSPPVGAATLAPFVFNVRPPGQDNGRRARLAAYFVELNR